MPSGNVVPFGKPTPGGNGGGQYSDLDNRLREVEKLIERIDERTQHLATRAWILGGVLGGMGIAAGIAAAIAGIVIRFVSQGPR